MFKYYTSPNIYIYIYIDKCSNSNLIKNFLTSHLRKLVLHYFYKGFVSKQLLYSLKVIYIKIIDGFKRISYLFSFSEPRAT